MSSSRFECHQLLLPRLTFTLTRCLQVLLVDCHPDSPSSTSAASNLIRCILSAGGVALVEPLLNSIGRGWTGTLIAAVWAIGSLLWWAVWVWGAKWRKEKDQKARQEIIEGDGSENDVSNGEKE